MKLTHLRTCLIGLCTAAALTPALAQDWPARPVRVIVAAPAGSGSDIIGRVVTHELTSALKQPFVIDNKPGALGAIANDAGAKATPDGYTLLFSFSSAIAVNHTLQPKLPYDALRDLVPVVQVGSVSNLILVAPDFPVHNVKELVQKAGEQPGLQYGSWGVGSGGHLSMEHLALQTNTRFVHVPYKGTPTAFADVMNGSLQVTTSDSASSRALIAAGKLRPIAAIGSRRVPALPDVPTMTEQGYPFEADGWYGFFVPTHTPRAVVDRLNAEVNRILARPEIREKLRANNVIDTPATTPEQFAAMIRKDIGIWGEVIRKGKIQLD